MTIQTDIRDAIVTVIESVTDSGIVHNRAKYSTDASTFLDNFSCLIGGKKILRGWWLSIPTSNAFRGTHSTFDSDTEVLEFTIRGIHSYYDNEDSETEFGILVYTVMTALRSQITFSQGPTRVLPFSAEVNLPIVELRQFGSTLCHYCEIRFSIETNVIVAWDANS